jgi:hypothetical protein
LHNLPRLIKCHICQTKLQIHPNINFAQRGAKICKDHGEFFIVRNPHQGPTVFFKAIEPEVKEPLLTPYGGKVKRSFAIRCDQTGEEFSSRNEAARKMGLWNKDVSDHLKGYKKHVKGYTFTLLGVIDKPVYSALGPLQNVHRPPSKPSRPIRCLETGVVFSGAGEASRTMGIHRTNIVHVLNGVRRQAGGYRFEYVTE